MDDGDDSMIAFSINCEEESIDKSLYLIPLTELVHSCLLSCTIEMLRYLFNHFPNHSHISRYGPLCALPCDGGKSGDSWKSQERYLALTSSSFVSPFLM